MYVVAVATAGRSPVVFHLYPRVFSLLPFSCFTDREVTMC